MGLGPGADGGAAAGAVVLSRLDSQGGGPPEHWVLSHRGAGEAGGGAGALVIRCLPPPLPKGKFKFRYVFFKWPLPISPPFPAAAIGALSARGTSLHARPLCPG